VFSLVSVIIPTYNRREYVQEAIDSVLAQTYPHYEIIVVDDGSTDGTGDVLKAKYGDRIRYVWQENQGESAARNRGIEMARGEYIAFLDSDDLWMPEKLEKQVAFLEAHPDVGAVICQALAIDAEGSQREGMPVLGGGLKLEDLSIERLLYKNSAVGPGTVLVSRRCLVQEIGGFDVSIRYGEDWDFVLRLRLQTGIGIVPEPLAKVRLHRSNQWRLPKKEDVERSLTDHLRLLERTFEACRSRVQDWDALRRRSLARQYAEAAFNGYARGLYARAQRWLAEAVSLDPQVWTTAEVLRRISSIGTELIAVEPNVDIEALREYVAQSALHLPAPLRLSLRQQRSILAALCANKGYRSYLSRDWRSAMIFTTRAVVYGGWKQFDLGAIKRILISAVRCAKGHVGAPETV